VTFGSSFRSIDPGGSQSSRGGADLPTTNRPEGGVSASIKKKANNNSQESIKINQQSIKKTLRQARQGP
jgi:hypothetical protein